MKCYFIYKGKYYHVNIRSLVYHSDYFWNKIIKGNYNDHIIEQLTDCKCGTNLTVESVETFTSFFANQNIQINTENVFNLNQLANFYDVKTLKFLINNFIQSNPSLFTLSKLFANGTFSEGEETVVANNLINFLNKESDKKILLSLPVFLIERILSTYGKEIAKQNREEENSIENETKIMNFMLDYLKKYGRNASPIFASIDFVHVGKECVNQLLQPDLFDKFDFTFLSNKIARILAQKYVDLRIILIIMIITMMNKMNYI